MWIRPFWCTALVVVLSFVTAGTTGALTPESSFVSLDHFSAAAVVTAAFFYFGYSSLFQFHSQLVPVMVAGYLSSETLRQIVITYRAAGVAGIKPLQEQPYNLMLCGHFTVFCLTWILALRLERSLIPVPISQ
mmetsp:Transcript_39802/g.64770  ORF Transcript_39802/g.64770 Transcript_39802/m.64770 type:complete len:133 (-) Transcript_39802:209-607(-)